MKRLFFVVVALLLAFNCFRVILNPDNVLSARGFLDALSRLDLDFSSVLGGWQEVVIKFNALTSGSGGFFEKIGQFFTFIGSLLTLPINLIIDVLEFLSSCLTFVSFLLGFEVA